MGVRGAPSLAARPARTGRLDRGFQEPLRADRSLPAPSGVQAGLHPPRYAALLKPSSPRFGHSSVAGEARPQRYGGRHSAGSAALLVRRGGEERDHQVLKCDSSHVQRGEFRVFHRREGRLSLRRFRGGPWRVRGRRTICHKLHDKRPFGLGRIVRRRLRAHAPSAILKRFWAAPERA